VCCVFTLNRFEMVFLTVTQELLLDSASEL
jgi:hypothetical protein